MNEKQLMEQTDQNEISRGGEKIKKKLLNNKLLKNNKGFSLVELLIVIAIMGVMAVIAFNMFGGVLTNSKKRADDQQAKNIEKAILTYCVDSNDWKLEKAYKKDKTTKITLKGIKGKDLIQIFLSPVYDSSGREYGPYFGLKDPALDATAPVNANAYDPQWGTDTGGEYTDWEIVIYPESQAVKVTPSKDTEPPKVKIGSTPAAPTTPTTGT